MKPDITNVKGTLWNKDKACLFEEVKSNDNTGAFYTTWTAAILNCTYQVIWVGWSWVKGCKEWGWTQSLLANPVQTSH